MGKITRKAQEKHKISLSPAVSDFVKKVTTLPLAELPSLFSSWSQRWPYPRGDLNNWIEPLDRFDKILQNFISRYGLDQGPQIKAFTNSLLLEGSPGVNEENLKDLGFGSEGDRELIESILVFSRLLVEKCANRAVYNSTDRLNDLLNTTSLSLLHGTLRLTIFLAQRYSERQIPTPGAVKFYEYDHDRLQRLATAIGQTPVPSIKRPPSSPTKTTKGKEKSTQTTRSRRSSLALNPNDFRIFCKDNTSQNSTGKSTTAPDREWQSWAYVKVQWTSPKSVTKTSPSNAPRQPLSDIPVSPTPVRRLPSSVLNSSSSNPLGQSDSLMNTESNDSSSGLKHIEISPSELMSTTAEDVLRKCPEDMPANTRYELLHKLRVAYGLISSPKNRRELLAVRLLAINSIANVFSVLDITQKLFGSEPGSSKPQELVQQLMSLIQDAKKGQSPVSLYLQTLSMETIGVLARHKAFAADISAALGANSNHGLLLRLTQKGLADIAQDNDSTDTLVGDDWREAIFSMPRVVIEATGHHGRSSDTVIASTFLAIYVSGLKTTTGKALRVHLRMLDFIKTFFHHFKDGLPTLLASDTFDTVSNLLNNLAMSAWERLQAGEGIPSQFKTRATDYEIPYMHQQVLRSIIDMINDISGHQGAHADRVLRSLVDSRALLNAFRIIIDRLQAFGAYTWSEIIKAICGFLHNEPTSYAIVAEAGIIKSLLNTVTEEKQTSSNADGNGTQKHVSAISKQKPSGIPAALDAIVNVSQAFGAICLTSAGFELFQASGALETFFELFESPAHVKILKDGNTLAMLGSTFDELVRHHPNLRSTVLSAVIVMVARVVQIGRSLASSGGAGPKLWLDAENDQMIVSGGKEQMGLEILPEPRLDADGHPMHSKALNLPNGDVLEFEEHGQSNLGDVSADDKDSHGLSVTDYVRPAICFLMNFFENQSLCSSFMDLGGTDIVLDLITIPSLPVNESPFGHGGFFHELASVIHMMAETKPHLILPVLADRIRFACHELRQFTNYQPQEIKCYFEPFVQPFGKPKQPQDFSEIENNGTKIIKSLMAVYCHAQVLRETFNMPIYSTRSSQNFLLGQVNLSDIFAEICKMLGGVSAACYREEIALQRVMPNGWVPATRPANLSTGDDEVDKIFSLWDSSPSADNAVNSLDESKKEQTSANADTLNKDKQTAAFRNAQTLRYLLIATPPSVTEFMTRLGRSIVGGKRKLETFSKQKASLVAEALARAYLTQLQPSFLPCTDDANGNPKDLEARFSYFVVALFSLRRSFSDDSHGPGARASLQTFVVEAFKKVGGLKTLTKIGIEFFDELKSCKVEQAMLTANTGLKICLDILVDLTGARSIIESPQSNSLKSTDPYRPFYFVPSQVLLELRMESLQLTQLIWTSEYADQASDDILQKLVSILNHILTGDHELEAIQTDVEHHPPALPSPRNFPIDNSKVSNLKEKGYDEELAREALYRCNTHNNAGTISAEEYCRALAANPRRRTLPVPGNDTGVPAAIRDTPSQSSPMPGSNSGAVPLFDEPPSGPIEAALAEVVNSVSDDDHMEDAPEASQSGDSRPSNNAQTTGTSAMDLSNILNGSESPPRRAEPAQLIPTRYSVESINTQRESIREDLVERCNNVLNHHQTLTFELADLISSATKRLSDEAARTYWETTSDLLVSSLLSMETDEEVSEIRGKTIAAAAHLAALLIQDNEVFKKSLVVFQDSFEGLLSFLQLPSRSTRPSEDSYPWIAPVLLIIERMLSIDSEPAEVKWEAPADLDSSTSPVIVESTVLTLKQKKELFDALMTILPRVGKDKATALSIARVLVILTRKRDIAALLSERRNLQRLFLMIKQLTGGVGGKLQSAFMIILRHVVEDEPTLRQIIRSEIIALFTGRNMARQVDTSSFTRELGHLVLRSPETFLDVTEDVVKLATWQPHSSSTVLVLKETPGPKADGSNAGENENIEPQTPEDSLSRPAASVETPFKDQQDDSKVKNADIKAPVVEHPDGVIHFILSELLAYKDVEDQETAAPTLSPEIEQKGETTNGTVQSDDTFGSRELPPDQGPFPKTEKPKFKPEDHPIFMYRCFLLQCLCELLYSYNRTKVEFINFSRKADPMATTPSKPRSGILNYLLNGIVPSGYVEKDDVSIQCKKKLATSDWAIRVVVALCSKTGEMGLIGSLQRYSSQPQVEDEDNEPDLAFVRRFALEHAIKAFRDAASSAEPLPIKYSRILCLSDMFNRLLSKPSGLDGSAGSHNTSYKILGRMMFEKNLISVLNSSLADIDLSYPGSKRVIKFILRPLQELTTTATQLSLTSPETISSAIGNMTDDVISSASSVSEVDDGREETPDLFRNSALGMLDPSRTPGSDSESGEEDEDEEEEMYDEEYADEMEYDEGMQPGPNDDEAVSDEDLEDGITTDGPIEGLSGDVPMDIEFVVNNPQMDVDSDDDDDDEDVDDDEDGDEEDEDEEDEDDGDEDEDEADEDMGDDFMIEGDDAGEVNADDENDSLGDVQDDEDWEDDEGEDDDASAFALRGPGINIVGEDSPSQSNNPQNEFNNLLRVLGEQHVDEPITVQTENAPAFIIGPAGSGDLRDEDDDDEDDDEEEMDENEDVTYDNFDQLLDGGDDILDHGEPWGWNEPPPMIRRHRHGGVGHISRLIGRRLSPTAEFERVMSPPTRHGQGARANADDGTNPLLQRPLSDRRRPARPENVSHDIVFPPGAQGFPGFAGFPPFGAAFSTVIRDRDVGIGGHGAMLDAIMQAVNRRERDFFRNGRLQFNVTAPLHEIREVLQPPLGVPEHRHHSREEPGRGMNFTPILTLTRWQEEAKMLFGNIYIEKSLRMQTLILSQLVPPAQAEERARQKKKEEEAKAEKEEMERLKAEAERLKEAQDREAAAKTEEESRSRVEVEVSDASADRGSTAQVGDSVEGDDADGEPMEGVQPTGRGEAQETVANAPTSEAQADEATPRVFTTIRGRQLDITGLSIDADYLEALPEDLREEVIMQQYATRREEAQQEGGEAAANGIDPEFLDALPDDIREEIRQQEAHAQRRREREAARRQAANTSGGPQAEEMDNDNFLATLDPALRRAILAEQPNEILQQLDPRHAAEGRAHARRVFHHGGIPIDRQSRLDRGPRDATQRDSKRQVVQLVDKAGVATLLRLMFLQQQGSLRTNLWYILKNICGNRQTRFDVVNMLLVILREGSTDVTAIERSLASLSLRAKANAAQKTPQPLKRTLSIQPTASISEEVTPLVVVQQCLSALRQLSQHGFHIRTIFLREIDVSANAKSRKGKVKENKTTKYPINDLISLLDRKLIMESSSCLQSLAELLAAVTSPLMLLMRKEKEKSDSIDKKRETDLTNTESTEQPDVEQEPTGPSSQDLTMTEAPGPAADNDVVSTESVETTSAAVVADTSSAIPDAKDEEHNILDDLKSKKQFDPPVISEHNLQLIVGIFVAQECNSDTFHSTLETLSSLSFLPETKPVFSKELINHVKILSQSICADLDELLPQIREAQSSTDLHAISSTKFSQGGSDQVKLLRVLQALDYLSAPKKDHDTKDTAAVKSILTSSYESLSLGPLWTKLSECLRAIHEKDNTISFATILLHLVESLMVVCKNTSLKDSPLARQAREQIPTSPVPESLTDLEELFFNFTTEHRKILNDIIRQSPKLMQGNGSFSLLVKNPKVLDFDNKRAYFTKQIHSRLHQQRHVQPPLQLSVRREQVFLDSYKSLYFKSADEMKYGKLNIRFKGEEGVDAGGVTREWFQVLARGIFNPDWALWQPVAADRTTFHPNPLSWINGEHLLYFKFIGRIIGKALHEGRVLDCHFSRAVYKRMLGKQPNLRDLESMDLDYYKSLVWILENDITDVITEDFSVIEEQFGEEKIVDLVPNGRNVPVDENNKREYVQKLVEYRLTTSVKDQLDNFILGFHDIIPAELVAIFDEQELELLISGLPEIDVDDWKANTEYHNYTAGSPQVTWFWRIVRGMSNEERAKLLQFITGTSKVPLNGFKDLEGMQGTTKFSIHKDPSQNRLPTSHTCFNQLDLPAYDDFETAKTNLMTAINLGADYFGFA